MYAFVSRVFAHCVVLRAVHTLLVAAIGVSLTGCMAFLSDELNNRGGFVDAKLDERWMIADTKQMRILRAYVLIGSVARMAQPKFDSERELIVQHVNVAIKVAADAYNCAYAPPGTCVYFDERMVEAEIAVLKLLAAVITKSEEADLFESIGDQLSETFPLLKAADSLTKVVDAVSDVTFTAATAAKAVSALLKAGKVVYTKGRRIGALYRDSVELNMVATLSSLDAMCAIQNVEFIEWSSVRKRYQTPDWASSNSGQLSDKLRERLWAMNVFYGRPEEMPRGACAAFRKGLSLWHKGSIATNAESHIK